MCQSRAVNTCRPRNFRETANGYGRRKTSNMKGNHMKRTKLLGTVAICVAAFSVLLAQTKPRNPSVPGNNPPSVPGNNPSLPNNNPPHVPGNTNPSLPNNNPPHVPGNTNPSLPNNNPPAVPGNTNPSLPIVSPAPGVSPITRPAPTVPAITPLPSPGGNPSATPGRP